MQWDWVYSMKWDWVYSMKWDWVYSMKWDWVYSRGIVNIHCVYTLTSLHIYRVVLPTSESSFFSLWSVL